MNALQLPLLLPMSAFALAASISPGPVNIVCLSSGTNHPISQGLIFVTGATLGFVALFLGIGAGLYSLLDMVPMLDETLRLAGVLFLLYLSYQLLQHDGRLHEQGTDKAPGFMAGAMMQWLNPKAWLASAAGIGAYTSGNEPYQLWLFAGLYLPICWLSLASWVYAGAFLKRYIHRPFILLTINRTLALCLAASAIFLLF
ncbi:MULTISPECIES: LysE family translocator [unclassified Halomonas]|uniref:LysE family translocator n=1 Tax=unclassified Halomonas TaxID=2609666 RepID=UPI0006DAD047|nr:MULTISPECIES: LysE family transporter [unclassified Halomonas]KPQ22239.1 MAG: putative threonine efflux protein [Halomonas sp. HL-93]SBR48175.1 Threonine/homoserine/homoserine lactone efflux protein [Halomonas sp. HL-93]SNY95785.1 Threonine/homoserine/homoserine lactone efflux protein [Halomonas sp. hl-4]